MNKETLLSSPRRKTFMYIAVLVVIALIALWGVQQGWFTTLLVGEMPVVDSSVAPMRASGLIDVTLFDDPRWKSMTNRGSTINERETGRRNPFSTPENQ